MEKRIYLNKELLADVYSYTRKARKALRKCKPIKLYGQVVRVVGLTLEVQGINAGVGEFCIVKNDENKALYAEVVGFKGRNSILMPLGEMQGVHPGCLVLSTGKAMSIKVGEHLLGKVLDGLGNIISDAEESYDRDDIDEITVDLSPINPLKRKRITEVLPTGVRAIDAILTCGSGQRIGIFSGSGVGKSTLLGMIAKHGNADVNVIALIGERGREVLDFIETNLGEEGLKKSIVISATSDQPALVRLKGAFVATSIAECFRDKGKRVMLLMDSVTRFAMAQREVGLAVGEPPATKGYTPSVFALLPKLLERSGITEKDSITAFYTVLVEGDDMDEPIADAVRGILDGHIVLSRKLAFKNHFPAIDILQSVSRIMPDIVSKDHLNAAAKLRQILSIYRESEDLINIGAYVKGSNPRIDKAIEKYDKINDFLTQLPDEYADYSDTIEALKELVEENDAKDK